MCAPARSTNQAQVASDGSPQEKDVEGEEPEPKGFGVDPGPPRAQPVPTLWSGEGAARGVQQLRLVSRPAGHRRRLDELDERFEGMGSPMTRQIPWTCVRFRRRRPDPYASSVGGDRTQVARFNMNHVPRFLMHGQ